MYKVILLVEENAQQDLLITKINKTKKIVFNFY